MELKRSSHRMRSLLLGLGAAALGVLSLVGPALAQNAPSVQVMNTEKFGPILVDHNGMTLYTWVVDEPPMSTCYGSCATSWPPALVDGPVTAPQGLPGQLGTTPRNDGMMQLTYNDWPLYRYARDTTPGEITGDGSYANGGLWPVVPTGAFAATVKYEPHPRLGAILTDANGMTLYTWEADAPGFSTCYDACAATWPPVLVSGDLIVGPGLSRVIGTTTRDDGTVQVTFKDMPLYTFRRDEAPGQMNGEGSTGFGALWPVAIMDLVP
jgi:predicted lipoprotein with Yx(FWY)xxD motif